MKRKNLNIIGLISIIFGALAFWNASLATMSDLLDNLIAIAAVIFAILGAWLTLLNPVRLLDEDSDKTKSRRRYDTALRLSPALKQATFAFAAVILIRILLPVLPGVGVAFNAVAARLWPDWEFYSTVAAVAGYSVSSLLGAAIVFLYLFEIVVLVLTLLPMLRVEAKHEEDEYKEEIRKDPASVYDRIEG